MSVTFFFGTSIVCMLILADDGCGGCGGSDVATENLTLRIYFTSKSTEFDDVSVILTGRGFI